MQSQLQAAINQICAEKNIDKDIVISAIEDGIAFAYKKDFGHKDQILKVILGDDISELKIFEERDVVKKVENFETEIALKDAQKINPVIEIDQTIFIPLKMEENFGRIAAQTAKHVMSQKLQEAERLMLFDKFKDREGDLLTARVQKVDTDSALIEIEGITTILPKRGQIYGEKYFTGQRLKVYLESVEQTGKGPQLKITRTSNKFIDALFEAEIPEIREGLVYIAKMSREHGVRCKIAVAAEDNSIDPVGAFVGQRGSRINAVMEEVGDERLDIIQYHDDPKKLLIAALSPAKIAKVEFFKGERGEDRVKIFVREEERAITIGRKGQNVRLAGQLIGMQIDVITFDGSDEEDESMKIEKVTKKKEKKEVSEKLTIDHLEGVEKEVIATLMDMGLSQIKQFEGLQAEELAEIGISISQAKSVVKAVKLFLNK
jgi:N utilization substance protein A